MDREEGLALLAGRGWLRAAGPEVAARLLALARWRRFMPGEALTQGGEARDDLVGIAEGTVAFTSALGVPETPVTHMSPAVAWMGYGPALLGRERVVTAEARTVVWAASIPGGRVRALMDQGAVDRRHAMLLLAEYGDLGAVIAADLLIRDSRTRCAAVLARFAGLRTPLAGIVPDSLVPVTQGELAAACNLSRNVTGAILRDWAAAGIVATGYGGIAIHDPAGLLRIAGGPIGVPGRG